MCLYTLYILWRLSRIYIYVHNNHYFSLSLFYFVAVTISSALQDQTKRTKPSTLRRTLNALRQRLTRRSRTKPPDWFLEKFSNTNNVDKIGKTTTVTTTAAVAASEEGASGPTAASTAPADEGLSSEIRGSSRLCNRLSVNPTLQSHYRVSGNILGSCYQLFCCRRSFSTPYQPTLCISWLYNSIFLLFFF